VERSLHALRGIKLPFFGQCTECTEQVQKRQPDSSQRSSVNMCLGAPRNATHVTATALPHPLINPARVLAEGGHQMLGLCGPLQGPHREGCHSHIKPYSIQVFHPSQNSKFSFLPLFLLYYNRNSISAPFITNA
jgi:hypothetical protein